MKNKDYTGTKYGLSQRLTAVRERLEAWDVDGVLISSTTNRRWLSGFTGSNGQLLIGADIALLATDFRYYQQATAQAPHFTLFKHERTPEATEAFLETAVDAGITRIGVERQHVTLAQMAQLRAAGDAITWVELETTVEPMRAVKHAAEAEAIRTAAAITDAVMAQVPKFARPGVSERELAWMLEKAMREHGADALAFPVTVASGPNSALPHHRPGARRLRDGDAIIVDMGAMKDDYRSDLTRTFFLGDRPTVRFEEMFALVQGAQTAVFAQTQPGMRLKAVDNIARDHIAATGHGEHFGHGLGHGVGLDIHEAPFLSPRAEDDALLHVGMTVTIEPGVYIPDWGGIRIEDLAMVTEEGLVALSHCPKEPVISTN